MNDWNPDQIRLAIKEALVLHGVVGLNHSHVECLCGWYLEPTPKPGTEKLLDDWRSHLSQAIADSVLPIWQREAVKAIEAARDEHVNGMLMSDYDYGIEVATEAITGKLERPAVRWNRETRSWEEA